MVVPKVDIAHGSAFVPNLRIVERPCSSVVLVLVLALIERGRASTRKGRNEVTAKLWAFVSRGAHGMSRQRPSAQRYLVGPKKGLTGCCQRGACWIAHLFSVASTRRGFLAHASEYRTSREIDCIIFHKSDATDWSPTHTCESASISP